MVSSNAWWVVAATIAALAMGTAVRVAALRSAAREVVRERLGSLTTWWILTILVIGAALLGRVATTLLFALISAIALREFVRLARRGPLDGRLAIAAAVLIPPNYLLIWLGQIELFAAFVPLTAIFLLSAACLMAGGVPETLRSVTHTYWGILLTVYCPAHAVLLLMLPAEGNPVAGGIGWFLFLIVLVELNDINQALVGRRLGRHRIAPRISPHKSWEGFAGGVIGTVLLALVLARWLTPLSPIQAAVAGLLIAVAGFLGDLNMSAVKRDAGVKNSSRLLPGQGGMLDRVDSLTFAAPALYYFVTLSGISRGAVTG